jgi:hypothetical protein
MLCSMDLALPTDNFIYRQVVGLGGLGVACSPRDPRFEVSNPAGRDFKLGVPSLRFQEAYNNNVYLSQMAELQ